MVSNSSGIYIYIHSLWLLNIARENGPFIDGLPIKTGDFLQIKSIFPQFSRNLRICFAGTHSKAIPVLALMASISIFHMERKHYNTLYMYTVLYISYIYIYILYIYVYIYTHIYIYAIGTGDLQTRHLTGAEPRLSSSGEMPMGSPLQRKEMERLMIIKNGVQTWKIIMDHA